MPPPGARPHGVASHCSAACYTSSSLAHHQTRSHWGAPTLRLGELATGGGGRRTKRPAWSGRAATHADRLPPALRAVLGRSWALPAALQARQMLSIVFALETTCLEVWSNHAVRSGAEPMSRMGGGAPLPEGRDG